MRGCAIARRKEKTEAGAEQGRAEQTKGDGRDRQRERRDNVSLSPQQSRIFADMMRLCNQERAVSSGLLLRCCGLVVLCCADRRVGERTNTIISFGPALDPSGAPPAGAAACEWTDGRWPPALILARRSSRQSREVQGSSHRRPADAS